MTTMVPTSGGAPKLSVRGEGGRLTRSRTAYLYILPFFLLFFGFSVYPLLYSGVLSFMDYEYGLEATWNGLDNYLRAFQDPNVLKAFRNVLLLMGVVLPCQLAFGFLIASVMHNLLGKRTGLLSGVYYLPVVSNLVVVALIFQVLFQQNGIVNFWITSAGGEAIGWLTSPTWAPIATMALIFWKGVGWYIVFLLAGMRNIDPALYEAAKLDGANALQRAIHVSLPQLRPVMTFLLVLGIISGWQIFTEPYLLFNSATAGTGPGGPGNAVLTPAVYIYNQGFNNLDFGYAGALSVLLGIVTVAASVIVLAVGRRQS